jgi:hypothetical protein
MHYFSAAKNLKAPARVEAGLPTPKHKAKCLLFQAVSRNHGDQERNIAADPARHRPDWVSSRPQLAAISFYFFYFRFIAFRSTLLLNEV